MNYSLNRNQVIFLATIIILPFVLSVLSKLDSDRGLIWFVLHQLYYLPLSWVGESFFQPDSEVGYFVKTSGRMLVAFIYALSFTGFILLKRKFCVEKYS